MSSNPNAISRLAQNLAVLRDAVLERTRLDAEAAIEENWSPSTKGQFYWEVVFDDITHDTSAGAEVFGGTVCTVFVSGRMVMRIQLQASIAPVSEARKLANLGRPFAVSGDEIVVLRSRDFEILVDGNWTNVTERQWLDHLKETVKGSR